MSAGTRQHTQESNDASSPITSSNQANTNNNLPTDNPSVASPEPRPAAVRIKSEVQKTESDKDSKGSHRRKSEAGAEPISPFLKKVQSTPGSPGTLGGKMQQKVRKSPGRGLTKA